uniref:E74-like factor 3 (ets domain transcription factor, epithelial-specific ) n=1 Tax=Monopterus albus TaxID=43700 RepID=A0A3Q3KIS4_MONAL
YLAQRLCDPILICPKSELDLILTCTELEQTPLARLNIWWKSYKQITPNCWTADNVLEWISDQVESTKFDANTLSLAYCTMDGPTLCEKNEDEMIEIFGPQLGPQLHQSLQEYKTKYEVHIKTEKGDSRVKRPRGRPPKLSRQHSCNIYHSPKKNKHAPRGTHLWEFIRDILINPERNQGLMKWEDRHEGVFKFLKSEAVAQMWGQKKKNSSMTYEKLSRAMRYYYKREILERVDGRRLVYKFGKNSSGWKIEEIGMGM